jgi:hypothetical protein
MIKMLFSAGRGYRREIEGLEQNGSGTREDGEIIPKFKQSQCYHWLCYLR